MTIVVTELSTGTYSVNGETVQALNSQEAIQSYLGSHSSGERVYFTGD